MDNVHWALQTTLSPALQSSLLFQPWASHISLPVPFTYHVHDFLPYQVFGSYEEKQPVTPKCVAILWCQKKSHIGHISLATKITDFDLRSLEVKGLHQLPAKHAPKCSACMKLEHNKCFLWAEPAALKFLSSSDLLQSWVFRAFGGGEVRVAVSGSLPLPAISEVVWLFWTWLTMNQNKSCDQP